MNRELQGTETGLIAYYKFNQGVTNILNPTVITLDDEMNNFNGALTNFGLVSDTSNWMISSVNLHNNFNLFTSISETIVLVPLLILEGQLFFDTGNYFKTYTTLNGCDSVVSLQLNHTITDTRISKTANVFLTNRGYHIRIDTIIFSTQI